MASIWSTGKSELDEVGGELIEEVDEVEDELIEQVGEEVHKVEGFEKRVGALMHAGENELAQEARDAVPQDRPVTPQQLFGGTILLVGLVGLCYYTALGCLCRPSYSAVYSEEEVVPSAVPFDSPRSAYARVAGPAETETESEAQDPEDEQYIM